MVENRHLGRAFHETLARVEEERSGGVEEQPTLDDAHIVALIDLHQTWHVSALACKRVASARQGRDREMRDLMLSDVLTMSEHACMSGQNRRCSTSLFAIWYFCFVIW